MSRLTRYVASCLTLLPACLLAILIVKYAVDMPQSDQWAYVFLFQKVSQGTLTLRDLFLQYNEYRQFFPNLLFVGLGEVTRWNVKYEMLVTFVFACLVSFNIYRLAKTTIKETAVRLFLFLLANLLIFSPSQHENWLQGQQLVYYLPIACVTTCIVVCGSRLTARGKYLICAGLSTICTFSSANGMLCWIVTLPVLLISMSWPISRKQRYLVPGWIFGFLCNAVLYLYGYRKPASSPSLATVLVHPVQSLTYSLAFLGAPLGLERGKLASVVGAILVPLFAACCIYVWKFRSDLVLVRCAFGWLAIGAYSILTAAMITVGRSGISAGQSMAPRYIAFSTYLIVALIFLVRIITTDVEAKKRFAIGRAWLRRFSLVAAGLLMLVQPLIATQGIIRMRDMRIRLLQAKASLLFINLVASENLNEPLFPAPDLLARKANALNQLGFERPALIKSTRVEDFTGGDGPNEISYGSLDSLDRSGNNLFVASGWAALPYRGDAADAVILSYQGTGGDSVAFAIAHPGEGNTGFRANRRESRRWRKTFSINQLPSWPTTLTAWAFDANSGKAYRLKNSVAIPSLGSLSSDAR